ncbi:MAG: haloacid dehalogenase type II [Chloroflexota bacterium]
MSLDIQALTFDVFGTVVDWRTAVIREGQALRGEVDWPAFADRWRGLYRPTINAVIAGERPWASFDELQRWMLEQVLPEFGLTDLTEAEQAELSTVWRRLDPWPDAAAGLARMKEHLVVCALSNGSVWQLIQLARFGGLPWDAVFSVELFRAYKPDPRVYRGAADLLQLPPEQVMMVAAHVYDLRAARANGMKTAFVARPLEWGSEGAAEVPEDNEFDLVATDFLDLASQLERNRLS